ncbi:MAG: hypothetical protein JW864_15730, partial [Spirochaetes bacterium]|nr:hypothetical protein [Spirochaetota bacterium]
MPLILILTASVVLQFSAVFFAFRVVRVAGKKYFWIMISAALLLTGIRSILALYNVIFVPETNLPDPESEIVLLFFSF